MLKRVINGNATTENFIEISRKKNELENDTPNK